jgi:NitT/TauT family transport system substrate-binding protein
MQKLFRRRETLATLGACLLNPGFRIAANADELAIRISGVPFEVTAQPYYAQEMGFFKKAGLTASLDAFSTNGAAIAAAVEGGSLDVGVSNVPSLVGAHLRGLPLVIVAGAGLYTSTAPGEVLMVPNASPLRTAKDLEGKTIAINSLKSIAQYGPQAWIDQQGADSSKVNFIELTSAAIPAALTEGRVDAGLVNEPFIGPAKKSSRIFADCFDAVAPRFMVSAYFTTIAWARAHPDLLRRFVGVMHETAVWANKNKDRSAEILAGVSKIPLETIRVMNRTTYSESVDPRLIQPVIDVSAHYGGAKSFAASEMIFKG